jgi:hypothetical protein
MSSNPINIPNGPNLPNIGYYSKNNTDNTNTPNNYSYNTLINNLTNSCVKTSDGAELNKSDTIGIYDPKSESVKKFLPDGTNPLDVPFYLAKSGQLMDPSNTAANLGTKISEYCNKNSQNIKPIINQIQYLTCQLEQERNREYDPSFFELVSNGSSLKETFNRFKNLKPFLIFLFIITMYLLVSGFFGSIDMASNIFDIVSKSNKEFSVSYWGGLFVGIAIPVIVLCYLYTQMICNNLRELEKLEITDNPYGIRRTIPSDLKKFDFAVLILFIFVIYAFIAVLFTIKKDYFPAIIYNSLVSGILLIITVFIYILYQYVPFFNTADEKNILNNNNQPLKLFIDQQETVSEITTNQTQNDKIKHTFLITFIVILILAALFFILNSKNQFLNGILSSSAILSLPLIWIFNFILGISYFYVYPMLYVFIRFFRYILMSIVYIISENSSSLKDKFSDDLIEQLDNFKNYSPTWGLILVDEFKLFLNMCGYENSFSKIIVSEDNYGKNVSQNKFVSSGFLTYIISFFAKGETNMKGIIYSGILVIVTIIVSIVILYGIIKIQN